MNIIINRIGAISNCCKFLCYPCFVLIFSVLLNFEGDAQELSHSFELRYYSENDNANGETDFKGETEIFNTVDRINFLSEYSNVSKMFYKDSLLNHEVVTDLEAKNVLHNIKSKPYPSIRDQMRLESWKWLSYDSIKEIDKWNDFDFWNSLEGVLIKSGELNFKNNTVVNYSFRNQNWRFSFEWDVKITQNQDAKFIFSDNNYNTALSVIINTVGDIFVINNNGVKNNVGSITKDDFNKFLIEFDLENNKYNLFLNGDEIVSFLPLESIADNLIQINKLAIHGDKGIVLDNLYGIGYSLTNRVNYPYTSEIIIDQNFEIDINIKNWQFLDYDDSDWQEDILPISVGGVRNSKEDLYLRKVIYIEDFDQAILDCETLDPSGSIWINGVSIAVLLNKYPSKINISNYLKKFSNNVISVKVDHFYLNGKVGKMHGHTNPDFNIGWFAGRITLNLTSFNYIQSIKAQTIKIDSIAELQLDIDFKNKSNFGFDGYIEVITTPWLPSELEDKKNIDSSRIILVPGNNSVKKNIQILDPLLWNPESPNLYSIRIVLYNNKGDAIDDCIIVTGIRLISQKEGVFRLNGIPEMLNGSQIFGYRFPLEKIVSWSRSPPKYWLVKEILQIKKMNGNMLRVHIHGWQNSAENVNDPRIAEICDQLGLMLIWPTPAWIRTGDGWGQIDFDGYPKYMNQVFNHPSIVMWELSNHPVTRDKSVNESNMFVEKLYHTAYPVDSSRLISLNASIDLLHFRNDEGTIDINNQKIISSKSWTAPMTTRGNMEYILGFGKEWSSLREWPPNDRQSFLDSKERAYFNFEHATIGQPNWNLVKGKPWYKLQSYEWDYDVGSIGRRLTVEEWEISQAWQALSAYESIRKLRILGYDGFSWCSLHGGPNAVTYKKPLLDYLGNAKLAFYSNRMAYQKILSGSDNVDVVYGPNDVINPVIINVNNNSFVDLCITIKNIEGELVFEKYFDGLLLSENTRVVKLNAIKPIFPEEGYYVIEYKVFKSNRMK